mmetsp:Transcript_92286/g.183237  ORF Transcript_92286/g.183237 Transcript_92286/m.183237 type:complete len:246 (+) Transcript_92286:238-975(+)
MFLARSCVVSPWPQWLWPSCVRSYSSSRTAGLLVPCAELLQKEFSVTNFPWRQGSVLLWTAIGQTGRHMCSCRCHCMGTRRIQNLAACPLATRKLQQPIQARPRAMKLVWKRHSSVAVTMEPQEVCVYIWMTGDARKSRASRARTENWTFTESWCTPLLQTGSSLSPRCFTGGAWHPCHSSYSSRLTVEKTSVVCVCSGCLRLRGANATVPTCSAFYFTVMCLLTLLIELWIASHTKTGMHFIRF